MVKGPRRERSSPAVQRAMGGGRRREETGRGRVELPEKAFVKNDSPLKISREKAQSKELKSLGNVGNGTKEMKRAQRQRPRRKNILFSRKKVKQKDPGRVEPPRAAGRGTADFLRQRPGILKAETETVMVLFA